MRIILYNFQNVTNLFKYMEQNTNNQNHFERFTKEAKQALIKAQESAKDNNTNYIGTEHILIGILAQKNSLGSTILSNFGVSLENINLVLKTVGRTQTASNESKKASGIALSGYAKQVIEDSLKCAHRYNHVFVGTEHLLFSLMSQENTAATVILENMKIDIDNIKKDLIRIFESNSKDTKGMAAATLQPPQGMNPLEFLLSGLHGVLNNSDKAMFQDQNTGFKKGAQNPTKKGASKTPALDYFTVDLTKEYREEKKDPIIGREKEIERVISILLRKTKNNPVIIGEPGVGKTAIAEGLAKSIVEEKVPDDLLDKKILSLSITAVVAGTKYRGEFEERVKQIIDEASSLDNVILFIDELHTVIGAGSAEGSLDAANILKPALSRGKIQVIGATTIKEYRKQIENDAALERRFQPVMVDEPNESETLSILTGIRESFEDHHNLLISDEALSESVKLSKRYINDRFLPDKAIDLIDEASALKGLNERAKGSSIKKYQQQLNKILKKKEEAVASQDYEFAAQLRADELDLIDKIEKNRHIKIPRDKRKTVTEQDIAKVISKMTGIPAEKLIKNDMAKLQNLEKSLEKRIVGQKEAILAVSNSIRRHRAGISDIKRPIGSFIFLGPTGVGKTELVKTLASEIFDDEKALIKIDMSEFMERHNTSRLVGATAGYIGYEEGGQLTEAVRRRPYSVILFDEIEKAHPDVFNMLLQILEDGYLTDAKEEEWISKIRLLS